MPDKAASPLYSAMPPARRYSGELGGLWHVLNLEAKQERTTGQEVREDLGWHWRVLPRGAVVALRRRGDLWGRRELRIARAEAPDSPKGWERWEKEVAVFLDKFGLTPMDGETPCTTPGEEWFRVRNEPRDEGKAAARFQELREAEVKPGRAICHDCLTETGEIHEIEWFPMARREGQRCNDHALAAGRRLLGATQPEGGG